MTETEQAAPDLIRQVEYWTAGLGVVAALATGLHWGWAYGIALATGVFLSLVNFRWLKRGVVELTNSSIQQAGAEKVRVPRVIYVKLFGRYVLLIGAAYVILFRFRSLALAVVAGFFGLVAGVLVTLVVHLFRDFRQA